MKEIQIMNDECKRDLEEAMPALRAAIKALDTLKPEQVQEVKSFVNPS